MDEKTMLAEFYAWLNATSVDRRKSQTGALHYNTLELQGFLAGYAAALAKKLPLRSTTTKNKNQ